MLRAQSQLAYINRSYIDLTSIYFKFTDSVMFTVLCLSINWYYRLTAVNCTDPTFTVKLNGEGKESGLHYTENLYYRQGVPLYISNLKLRMPLILLKRFSLFAFYLLINCDRNFRRNMDLIGGQFEKQM